MRGIGAYRGCRGCQGAIGSVRGHLGGGRWTGNPTTLAPVQGPSTLTGRGVGASGGIGKPAEVVGVSGCIWADRECSGSGPEGGVMDLGASRGVGASRALGVWQEM